MFTICINRWKTALVDGREEQHILRAVLMCMVQQQLIALIWLFNLKFVREPLLAPHFVLYFIGTSFKPKVLTVHMKTPYHNR